MIITYRSAGKTASGFKFPVLEIGAREQRTQLDLIKIMMMIILVIKMIIEMIVMVSKMIIEMIKMMNIKMIIEMTMMMIMIKISARSRCARRERQARSDLEQDDDSDDSAPYYDDDDDQEQAPEDVPEAVRLLDQQ